MDRKASDLTPLHLSDPENVSGDVEAPNTKKLRYPFSVFFIIVNEFCERFSYYGMRTVLTLYLTNILRFDEDQAVVLYHTFICLCYFTPVLGAVLADNYLGKFRTILYLSILYAIGSIILSVAAIPNTIPQVAFSLVGLGFIAFGTGGIKPCVSAFGGQQFTLPEQDKQLEQFFSVFYFSINAGSLISTFLTPVLRENVKCFGQDSCFSLAFGIPAMLMIVSVCIFVSGKKLYKIKPPESNIMGAFVMCIGRAIKRKITSKGEKHNHWLEFASDKYDMQLINDIKRVLAVGLVFLPLPAFWALYDQQGSRWTFQATRMNGVIGSTTIKPDQMSIVNPLLILLMVPLFESFVYPWIQKCYNFTPLRRIGWGMIFCGLSFIVSALLEMQLEPTYEKIAPEGMTQMNFINTLPCSIQLKYGDVDPITINKTDHMNIYELQQSANYTVTAPSKCGIYRFEEGKETQSYIIEGTSTDGYSVIITVRDNQLAVGRTIQEAPFRKSESGKPRLGFIFDDKRDEELSDDMSVEIKKSVDAGISNHFTFFNSSDSTTTDIKNLLTTADIQDLEFGDYEVYLRSENSNDKVGDIHVDIGACYLGVIQRQPGQNGMNNTMYFVVQTTPANSVHMLWLVPQYFVVTVGEVMFSVTGLQFSFTEAPTSMRSIMQAMWCLIVAFGNVIVIIVDSSGTGLKQSLEFFLFAGIMFAAAIVFMFLAMMYQYTDPNTDAEELKEVGESDNASNKEDDIDDSLSPTGLQSNASESADPAENAMEMTSVEPWLTATNLLSSSAEPQEVEENFKSTFSCSEDVIPEATEEPEEPVEPSQSPKNSLTPAEETTATPAEENQSVTEEPTPEATEEPTPEATEEPTPEATEEQEPAEPPQSPKNSLTPAEDTTATPTEENQSATEEPTPEASEDVTPEATEEVTPEVTEEQEPAAPSQSPKNSLTPAEETTATPTEENQSATEEPTPEVTEEQEPAEPSQSPKNSLTPAEETTATPMEENQSVIEETTPEVPEEQTPVEPSQSPENSLATEEITPEVSVEQTPVEPS